jgi:hypothetical protein
MVGYVLRGVVTHSLDFGARWVSESDGPSLGASIVDLHVRG